MSKLEQFDAILNSVWNGQYRQALSFAEKLDGYEIAELIDYIAFEASDVDAALSFCKAWFRHKAR